MEMQINITVNGQKEVVFLGVTLAAYLAGRGLKAGAVVAEVNRSILKPEAFADTALQEGDELEIIHFVGGG